MKVKKITSVRDMEKRILLRILAEELCSKLFKHGEKFEDEYLAEKDGHTGFYVKTSLGGEMFWTERDLYDRIMRK